MTKFSPKVSLVLALVGMVLGGSVIVAKLLSIGGGDANALVLRDVSRTQSLTEEAVSQGDNWSPNLKPLGPYGFRQFHIGEKLDLTDPMLIVQGELNPECDYVRMRNVRGEVYLMVIEERLVRVDIERGEDETWPPSEQTIDMLGVDSGVDEIYSVYRERMESRPNKYGVGTDYIVKIGNDLGLVFETENERVTSFRIGLMEQVLWVEGCS